MCRMTDGALNTVVKFLQPRRGGLPAEQVLCSARFVPARLVSLGITR